MSGNTGQPAGFMSVANYQHLMRVMKQFSADLGIDPASSGVRLNRLVYSTMADVDRDYPELGVYAKNKRTAEITAAHLSNAASSARTDACSGPITDEPISDIDRRIAELNRLRLDVDIGDPYIDYRRTVDQAIQETGSAASVLRPDLDGLRKNIAAPCDDRRADRRSPPTYPDTIITSGLYSPKRIVDKYLLVNGYDRVFGTHPKRFGFSINLSNRSAELKNVRCLAATRLIIPREIVQEKTITHVPKARFEYPFGLPFPYLILKIDDFKNVYKGSNDASKEAFCHFVFDTYYSSPSGRGYIHMVPMQGEKQTFDINPLASLGQMTLSVMRPSGALLNDSKDDTKVFRMDWNNQVNTNQNLIMVTLAQYYDRNEFYTGDTVRFTGFSAPAASSTINDFVNRPEGHDIVEFGAPNVDGYIASFYIRVPGELNALTGLFETDVAATTDLMSYIGGIDYTAPPDSIALVINATLQVAVSFRVSVEEEDVTVTGPKAAAQK
jgi:hypothetical protein